LAPEAGAVMPGQWFPQHRFALTQIAESHKRRAQASVDDAYFIGSGTGTFSRGRQLQRLDSMKEGDRRWWR
jgi:hypothetical protein